MSDAKPTPEQWMERAAEANRKALEARHRKHTLIRDCGYANPTWERWTGVVREATAEIREKYELTSAFFSSDPVVTSPREKARTRVVPSDCIPMWAQDIVGMAAAYADLEERLHGAEARLAEVMAHQPEIIYERWRELMGMP